MVITSGLESQVARIGGNCGTKVAIRLAKSIEEKDDSQVYKRLLIVNFRALKSPICGRGAIGDF